MSDNETLIEGRTVHNVPDPLSGELGVWCSAEWWGRAIGQLSRYRRLRRMLASRTPTDSAVSTEDTA